MAVMLVVGLVLAQSARANIEPPALYDARSMGMGGTGVAYIDSGAAVYHNPANLDLIGDTALTLHLTPTFSLSRAPFAGPGTETDAAARFVPLFFVGGGFRLHERVVIGFGAYGSAGTGGRFDNVSAAGGVDLEFGVGIFEATVPVSVRLTDELSLGIGVGLAFGSLVTELPQQSPPGVVKQDITGFGAPRFSMGLNYRPVPNLKLGLAYRSKVDIDFDGDTDLPGVGTVDTTVVFPLPHAIKLGGALTLLDDRLTIALDAKLQLYEITHDDLAQTFVIGGQVMDASAPLNWTTTIDIQIGFEYMVSPTVALRVGYDAATSATPDETASPFTTTPGFIQAFTAGIGATVDRFELGFGTSVTYGKNTLEAGADIQSSPGEYRQIGIFLGLSATYRD